MKINFSKKVGLMLTCATVFATMCGAQNVQQTSQGIRCNTQGMDISVGFYSPTIVRVYKTPEGKPYEKKSLVVTKSPESIEVEISQEQGQTILKSSSLKVIVNSVTGGIDFYTVEGKELLKDKDYGTSFAGKDDAGTPSYQVRGSFLLEKEEPVYGVGQVMDGKFNRRNSMHHLQNENMFTYSPYFMSPTKGYAVYWDNYSISEFIDTPQELVFQSLGHCADYYFMYGGTPDKVIAEVRDLTGHAPMLPLWGYGFFQSKERYHTQEESLDVLRKFRKLQIPIDCVIQDWRYWPQYQHTDSLWNSHSFDPENFPDPKKWVDEIHQMNAKLLIVAWPGFGAKTEQRKELDAKGMIINFDTWPPQSGARPYDAYNSEARDIYWKSLNKGIFSYINNDGWWLDSTEPDHINRKESDYDLPTSLGSYRSVKNAYSLMHNKGIASHQKAQNKDKRVLILTRSGFIGQQRYGSNTWSGDVTSTWDMLEKQIPAALNYTLMGIPNWNSDIGGFFAGRWNEGGGARNPKYQELYLRWMQFGTFCPMMRSHGTEVPREIWNFGERGSWCFDAQEKMIKLRYRLLPYIYSTSWDVSHNDGTFMRPLVMDFTTDKNTYEIGGEFLFGRSMLVAPVTRPEVTEWSVYLPEGTAWWDFWNNEKQQGGQTVKRSVSKDILPVYIKTGSILPFGPSVQYSTEKNWDNLEIRIYPGADGTFTLYEDENDNYNYEKGIYSTINFRWDDKARRLTIEDRKGDFPGMLKNRKFKVVVVDRKSGTGDQPMKGGKTVNYTGKEKSIRL
ncbi:glycoside hydrolase family 31 protein [Bacteroides sp.]